ncbi:hypothetical protein AGMMS50293_31480 [Spirochaetia bacterium]|nr:hypothetical protein AGMMS50293_31480 [Spirochaetia bacterium]
MAFSPFPHFIMSDLPVSLLPAIREIAALLARARRVLFITGAGVSADSGLPTYRGLGGLYEHDLTEEGIPIEDALSGEMLRRRPEIPWKYMTPIEENCRNAGPNAAHRLMAKWERELPYVMVLTQNIDGLQDAPPLLRIAFACRPQCSDTESQKRRR